MPRATPLASQLAEVRALAEQALREVAALRAEVHSAHARGSAGRVNVRITLLFLKREHVIRGKTLPAGTMLHVDEEMAAAGWPHCIAHAEAVGLWLDGTAVRPED